MAKEVSGGKRKCFRDMGVLRRRDKEKDNTTETERGRLRLEKHRREWK